MPKVTRKNSTPAQVHFEVPSSTSRHSSAATTKMAPWTLQRLTPFTRTPRSRRLVGKLPTLHQRMENIDSAVQASAVKEIIQKTWNLHKLSPLYNFNKRHLRKYSQLLSRFLESETQKGIAVGGDADIDLTNAEVSVLKGFQQIDNLESIQIRVRSSDKKREKTIVLHAVLCSMSGEISVGDAFTYYPIILIKGSAKLTQFLISWLQTTFDCLVAPLTFSSAELSWMIAMWAGFTSDKGKNKPVELLYKVPDEVEGLDKITIRIEAGDCKKLWNCIHDGASDEFLLDEVNTFMEALEAHYFNHFKIHLTALHLNRVGTPIAMIGCEGKLKVFSKERLIQIMRHICEIAIEHTDLS